MAHSSDSFWLTLIIMVFKQPTSSWTHLGSRIVASRQNCCASGDRVERLAGTGHGLAVGMMGKGTSGWWDEKGKVWLVEEWTVSLTYRSFPILPYSIVWKFCTALWSSREGHLFAGIWRGGLGLRCTSPKAQSLITIKYEEIVPSSSHRAFHFRNEHRLR